MNVLLTKTWNKRFCSPANEATLTSTAGGRRYHITKHTEVLHATKLWVVGLLHSDPRVDAGLMMITGFASRASLNLRYLVVVRTVLYEDNGYIHCIV